MIKFKSGSIEVKFLDSNIIVYTSKKRNVFNLLYSNDIDELNTLEKTIKECNDTFKFKMSFNARKDILKIVLNDVMYSLNAILI